MRKLTPPKNRGGGGAGSDLRCFGKVTMGITGHDLYSKRERETTTAEIQDPDMGTGI